MVTGVIIYSIQQDFKRTTFFRKLRVKSFLLLKTPPCLLNDFFLFTAAVHRIYKTKENILLELTMTMF